MQLEKLPPENTRAHMPTVVASIVALCVVVLAFVGILVVLEVLPRSALQEYSIKLGLVAAIVVVATLAVSLVLRAERFRQGGPD